MSIKKRFEQLEADKPEGSKKISFLEKFSFKRKLEIEGIAREQLPAEKPASGINPKSQTPEAKITQVDRSENEQSSVRVKLNASEPKIELEHLPPEIKIAEKKKRAQDAQQLIDQAQKKIEERKKEQFEDVRHRVTSAKIKVFCCVIALVIFSSITFHFSRLEGTGRRASGGDFGLLVFVGVAALFGQAYRWRDKW